MTALSSDLQPDQTLHPRWTPLADRTAIHHSAFLLSMQWHKTSDLPEAVRHLSNSGGDDVASKEFAEGLTAYLAPYMSRRDLRRLALTALFELERRNVETPNPQPITHIEAAVGRIKRQVEGEGNPWAEIPAPGAAIPLIDPKQQSHIKVKVGERFSVLLLEYASTGFLWYDPEPNNIVGLVDSYYRVGPDDDKRVGQPVMLFHTYQALAAGTVALDLKSRQPWAPENIGEAVSLQVEVTPAH